MFMGPLEASKPWSEQGVEGARRWIERVWRLVMESPEKITEQPTPELDYVYNFTVKKVSEDIDSLNFNTAISQMMIFINECYKAEKVNREMIINFIKLLSPIAPHVCEEMYSHYTGKATLAYENWPGYDEKKLIVEEIEVVVQVNGKMRGKVTVSKDASQDEVQAEAMKIPGVESQITGKTIRKVIYVAGKLINIVAN